MRTEPYTAEEAAESLAAYLEATKRTPRLIGPYSPFFECPTCGATHTSPLAFQHKQTCKEGQ